MEPRTRFLITSLACIAVFSIAGYLYHSGRTTVLDPDGYRGIDIEARATYWRERIDRVGGRRAYDEFRKLVQSFTTPQKHLNAHFFGTALYDVAGMAGVDVCDGSFSYGCFHAFMIRAVEDRGTTAAQELYTACRETLGDTAEQCQHGIGHGLLGITGYGPQDVDVAIAECDRLTPRDNLIGGCAGGVFMEYGLRGMQGLGLSAHRPFSEGEVLSPCTDLEDPDYHAACAYWQPMWWMETAPERGDDERMAEKMGAWCAQLPGGRETLTSCIAGIANRIQLLTDEVPSDAGRICALVTTDMTLREYCQRHSAQRYTVYYPLEFSLRACDGLPDTNGNRCREMATRASEARRRDQKP